MRWSITLTWLLLAPLTAIPVLCGSSDVPVNRLVSEVVGLMSLGILWGLVAPPGLARAPGWLSLAVVAPVVPHIGLPWAFEAATEAAGWAVTLSIVVRTVVALRRSEDTARWSATALAALLVQYAAPLSLGTVGLALPLALMTHALMRRGRLQAGLSIAVSVIAGVAALYWSRGTVLANHQLSHPFQRVYKDLSRLVPVEHPAPSHGRPVVIVTVDTLRHDHAQGMDVWSELAERGVVWENAMATSSWTVPSLMSLWTGAAPAQHGAGAKQGSRRTFTKRSEDVPHLAAQLSDAGYTTAAFVTNPLVTPELGFADGFQEWQHATATPPHPLPVTGVRIWGVPEDAERVTQRARAWLQRAPQRGFLLWLHFFDPHIPYTHSEEPWIARSAVEGSDELRMATQMAYAHEVGIVDASLTALLADLESRGFWSEGGIMVLTSDHGEEFWEHGGFEHGHSHHAEVVDIPMLIATDDLTPEARQEPASLTDIAPVLRELTGLTTGTSTLLSSPSRDRVVTASGNLHGPHMQSARSISRRVIVTHQQESTYDLINDPLELNPRPTVPSDPVVQAARAALPAAGTEAAVEVEQLRTLGYVE